MPRKDDILITARGTIGVGYVVKDGDRFYYKDGNIISLRPKTDANPEFILFAFRSSELIGQFAGLAGTTVRHLPIERAKELVLRIPSRSEQDRVVGELQAFQEFTKRLAALYQNKLAELDDLKSALLQKAFSGQL
jgi:type I restriction enzyme S subunit